MKKIVNEVEDMVMEMCEGIVKSRPNKLDFNKKYKIIKRKNIDKNKVSLISGGGSGHEPAHSGFVGKGMLDAAVCGDIFASPSIMQIYNGILDTESNKGTLLIVKNYSGDCMNFDAASEMAMEDDDIDVEKVYVNDDIAVADSIHTEGRRGVAGTIFVHKIAGASAERGDDLRTVKAIAEKTIKNVKSIGFALTSCTVPAKGTPTFSIEDDEIEYGVGIHGETGIERRKMASAKELVYDMMLRLKNELKLKEEDEIAIMINGLGATPIQELYIVNKNVHDYCEYNKINIYKNFVGNYMTAIDMAGASITILKLDDELKILLDAEVETLVFNW